MSNKDLKTDWAKFNTFKDIESIRTIRKEEVIGQELEKLKLDTVNLYVLPGQPTFFKFPIENQRDTSMMYYINIDDPDDELTVRKEAQLVCSSHEVKFWAELGKATPYPHDFCIQGTDTLSLMPGEKIELLFKFQTFRDLNDLVQASTADVIKERVVTISFTNKDTNTTQTIWIKLIPRSPPVDHVFRYTEPENSHFNLTIPPFMQFTHPELNVCASNSSAEVHLDNKTSCIHIQSRTESAMKVSVITLYLFKDNYRGVLLATVRLEITPLQCIFTKKMAGVESSIELMFPVNDTDEVELHSSDARCVYFERRHRGQVLEQSTVTFESSSKFRVRRNRIERVEARAKTYSPFDKKVIVNAIDTATGALAYQWMVIMQTIMPVAVLDEVR